MEHPLKDQKQIDDMYYSPSAGSRLSVTDGERRNEKTIRETKIIVAQQLQIKGFELMFTSYLTNS